MFEKYSSRVLAVVCAVAVAAVSLWGGYSFGYEKGYRSGVDMLTINNDGTSKPVVDFSPFWRTWQILNEKFIGSASSTDQNKVWGAIQGLTASLGDPYTVFFPPEDKKMFDSEIQGNFEGIGMEVGVRDEALSVVAPLKGSPAEKAGIKAGDKILAIDDKPAAHMPVDDAVKIIRGPKGTTVKLTLSRTGAKDPFDIKVVRDVINLPTLETKTKDGVFVIQLYSFSAQSPQLFRNALKEFTESGTDKLVLDLRGNPGGYLEAAVDMASWYLPMGKTVVTEKYGDKREDAVHRSRGYDIFNNNLKFAVLVDGGSASASEILAGALQDYGVATLVGTKTFGKGTVQELVDITPDTSLKVTVAKWYTPKDRSISDGGLTPDVEVKMTPDDVKNERDPQLDKAIEILKTK